MQGKTTVVCEWSNVQLAFPRYAQAVKVCRILAGEAGSWFALWLAWVPGHIGVRLRYLSYRARFASCGKCIGIGVGCTIRDFGNIALGDHVTIGSRSSVLAGTRKGEERVVMGNNVALNFNVMINADHGGEITMGSDVLVGPNVVIRTSNHRYERTDVPIRSQGHSAGRIVIADDVWIGANVVILPNVTIGKGAIVAAGAVVADDIDSYEIAGGVPAKRIGVRGKMP